MVRISPEQKRQESSDWFKGLIAIIFIIAAMLIGYIIYKSTRESLTQREIIKNYKNVNHIENKNLSDTRLVSRKAVLVIGNLNRF